MSVCPWLDIPPGEGFTRIPVSQLARGGKTQVRGLPDNCHTGGVVGSIWHPNDNPSELWKPLDYGAHPDYIEGGDLRRWPTQEWDAISLLVISGRYGAQTGARREVGADGRAWLVMPRYEDPNGNYMELADVLALEQTLRWFNGKGWSVGDEITVMFDTNTYQYVFVDLSCASFYRDTVGCYAADDSRQWLEWLTKMGWDDLVALRKMGSGKVSRTWYQHPELCNKMPGELLPRHIYVSHYRPFSLMWADKTDGDNDLREMWAEYVGPPYQSVIGTHKPLSEDYQRRYQLTWAYSPIDYQIEVAS
jgi:hypothetical protein